MAHEQHALGRFEARELALDPARGIALYVQLAAIFRFNVLSGLWSPGHRLDNFDVLAGRYGVARITVRQAVALMVHEGLMMSRRGRGTTVLERDARDEGARHRGPLGTWPDGLKINVVFKRNTSTLPGEFVEGFKPFDRYVEISKVHLVGEEPFAMVRLFVADAVFRRFPRKAIRTQKVLRLVLAHGRDAAVEMRQRMTVEPADPLVARQLAYTVGSPVAKILRQIHGEDQRLSYAGLSWYRGDRFEMDISLPRDLIAESAPALIAPGAKSRSLR